MAISNAPTPLSNTPIGSGILVFPGDLLSIDSSPTTTTGTTTAVASGGTPYSNSSGGFYSQFQFSSSSNTVGVGTPVGTGSSNGFPTFPASGGGIYLPLPAKINDIELALWQDSSYLDYVPAIAGTALGTAIGATNQALNPFMYMLFKQVLFREFVFQYILAPSSPAESQTLLQILYAFKTAALPDYTNNGFTLSYPWAVSVRLNPNQFLFDIKKCVIVSCEIDFSGSGHGPAFFNDGSPTIVSMTIHLKETQILTRSDVAGRGGTLSTSMINSSTPTFAG